MKNINLWLSDYIDYSLSHDDDINVLVNSSCIANFHINKNSTIVSSLDWLGEEELEEFANLKQKWTITNSHAIKNMFFQQLENNDIDCSYSNVLERLFYDSQLACLDAIKFAQSLANSSNKASVKIIVGNNYQLTTLSSLTFWLAACDKFLSTKGISFYCVSRKNKAMHFTNSKDLLGYLSSTMTSEPELRGIINNSDKDFCIAWTGALKFPHGWNDVIDPLNNSNYNILRIVEPGQENLMRTPLMVLNPSNGDSLLTLEELYDVASASICNFESSLLSSSVRNFYEFGVAPYIISHLIQMIDCISHNLYDIKVVNFYSVTAPKIESIALHISLAKKRILPTLLPHSFTHSYEFSSSTYKESLSFINSKLILNPLYDDLDGLDKERVISIDKIQMQNDKRISNQSLLEKLSVKIKLLNKYKLSRWPLLLQKNVFEYIHNKINIISYNSSIKAHRLCLGLLLNVESTDFNLHIDFNELNRSISHINEEINNVFDDVVLNIRSKPGWSNKNLLRESFSEPHSSIICPSKVSLEEYGKNCDLVLFIQGTSAVAELMRFGFPSVCINSEKLITRLDVEFISFPEEIVPRMAIHEILNKLLKNPQWPIELSKIQTNWLQSQMITSKE
jgi:hypothetical protein